jgi:hypothetical protein
MKHANSVSCSECLPLVTTITFINIMVFIIELGLCISNSHTLFLLIPHFRSLNKTIDFYIIFPSDSSSEFFSQCLTIFILPSVHFPPFFQSPYYNLLSTHNPLNITFCFFLSKWTWPNLLKQYGFLNLLSIAFQAYSPQYALKGAHKHVIIVRWASFPSQNSLYY